MNIYVDAGRLLKDFPHFWRSTGLSPARLLLHPAMRQAITHIGSLPHRGILHVRIHYLLELAGARGMDTLSPAYDWSELDEALDLLVSNGLSPFFELMGFPRGADFDFGNKDHLPLWRRFVRDMAHHCMSRYGEDEVRGWYFESWNEPDGPSREWYGDNIAAFLNYYDACAAGLRDADKGLIFGGPGTCVTLSGIFKAFLEHCDNGINALTGEKAAWPDFISVHEKGADPSPEDLTPDTLGICARENAVSDFIRSRHPILSTLPFMNNECDPQIGWSDFHTWHALPYYAALVCKVVDQHLEGFVDTGECEYALLSNDNAFLGRWGNRTLFACFGEPLDLRYDQKIFFKRREIFDGMLKNGFSLVKKPVFNAMVMLSMLGDRRCEIKLDKGAPGAAGAIAAKSEGQISVLVYHSLDSIMSSGSEEINLRIKCPGFRDALLVHYRIDEERGNPFRIWERAGAPGIPSEDTMARMRENQEPAMIEKREVYAAQNVMNLQFTLPLPSVSLILLCAKPDGAPGRIQNLRAEAYRGVAGKAEVMLIWDGSESRFLQTYEVLCAESPEGPFARINNTDTVCSAFLHGGVGPGRRMYKVRAVDFWGRAGEESEIVEAEAN